MQDIAEATGVARSTVSFVLNGKAREHRISDEVADRVRQTAKDLNYQFNEVARSLRTGSTKTIALIVADISDAFFGTFAYFLQEYALKQGYIITIFNTSEQEENLRRILATLKTRLVDGIVMVPISNSRQERFDAYNIQIPMVIVDRYFPEMKTSRVIIDNYKAGTDATRYLIENGCRKIAMLTYKESLMHMKERKRGYEEMLKKAGLFDNSRICEVGYTGHESAVFDFFSRHKDNIDGLFVSTGGLSGVAIKVLTKLRISIPKDMLFVGFDRNINTLSDLSVPFVRQPIERMCQCALDILINQINNKRDELVDCRLQATLVLNGD